MRSIVAEFARLHACDGRLDPTYCDAMSHALAAYLARRYGRRTGSAVRRAIAILATERVTVAELALRVGFSSPSHFARTFRRVTGVTPSRYVRVRAEAGG
ncbi:MAG TPA: AraC family transcriptional regulator [Thermodesulfobacteriota bacterium]